MKNTPDRKLEKVLVDESINTLPEESQTNLLYVIDSYTGMVTGWKVINELPPKSKVDQLFNRLESELKYKITGRHTIHPGLN